MTADSTQDRSAPESAVLEHPRRPAAVERADRVVRQVQGIDAWNTGRRLREQLLRRAAGSEQDPSEVCRQLDVSRRAQAAIHERTAQELVSGRGAMTAASDRTAVVAHRQPWFVEQMCRALLDRGVLVVACTDNAADALGAVVAEQPDIVLVGHRLAMMTGPDLLTQTRWYAAAALCAAQVPDDDLPFPWHGSADAIFVTDDQPVDIADTLLRLL